MLGSCLSLTIVHFCRQKPPLSWDREQHDGGFEIVSSESIGAIYLNDESKSLPRVQLSSWCVSYHWSFSHVNIKIGLVNTNQYVCVSFPFIRLQLEGFTTFNVTTSKHPCYLSNNDSNKIMSIKILDSSCQQCDFAASTSNFLSVSCSQHVVKIMELLVFYNKSFVETTWKQLYTYITVS